MNKAVYHIAILLALFLVAPAEAAGETPFPDSRMKAGLSADHAGYLGLPKGTTAFRYSDIKADWVLVYVFNLYCVPCQRGAADLNWVYDKVRATGLDGRIKFLGIAAGNTVRETEYWRQKYIVPFPLIPDGDYALHTALGNVGTPYFFLIRNNGRDALDVAYSLEGAFADKDAFLDVILSHAGEDAP